MILTARRFIFVFALAFSLFALCLSVSASDPDYPVYVGDVGFSSLADALSYSSDDPILVVGEVSLTGETTISRTARFAPTSNVICNGFHLYTASTSIVSFEGTIYQSSSSATALTILGGTVSVSGDILAPNYVCINVSRPSNLTFDGASLTGGSSCVVVSGDGLSNPIIVNGGSFYARGSLLRPEDAFVFPEGVDVIYQNGALYAISHISILSDIGRLVTESVSWISAFVSGITASPLLLAFVITAFVGTGIGLIKRLSYL